MLPLRLRTAVGEAVGSALKTSRWLLSLMIPVSAGVALLNYFGLLATLSGFVDPIFRLIGLSGQCAFVFLTSIFLNIYSAIAVITTLNLPIREVTILAFMCLVSHNLIVEVLILKKTGSSAIKMTLIRLGTSILGAIILNNLIPMDSGTAVAAQSAQILRGAVRAPFNVFAVNWLKDAMFLSLKVFLFLNALMILQRLLEEYGILNLLSNLFAPVLKIMGLPPCTSFLWIVANVLGLGYSAAIMFDHAEKGKIGREDNNLLNHHIAVNHSLLEDTLLFMAIGVSAGWITFPRIIAAMIIVWVYRIMRDMA